MKFINKLLLVLGVFVVLTGSAQATERRARRDSCRVRPPRPHYVKCVVTKPVVNVTNVNTEVTNVNNVTTNITNETKSEEVIAVKNDISNEIDARVNGDLSSANRSNDINSQLNEINETKIVGDLAVQLYDSKRFSVQIFDAYDVRHGHNFMAGTRVVYKLGRSYADKKIQQQQAQIDAIQAQLNALTSGRASVDLE